MAIGWIPWDVAVEAGAVVGTAGVAARTTTRKWLAGAASFARELAIVLVLCTRCGGSSARSRC